jgi:hypothetical protein
MSRSPVALALVCLLACSAVAPRAFAQYEVEQESAFWLRALLDVRIARGGAAPSWTDHGPGKPRFGGTNGFERETRFVPGQLAIEAGAALPWGVRAEAQINVQPDIADSYTPWLIDAFVRREWGARANGWGLQVGLTGVPFSLEHTGPAWSPEYSISASVLNSWLWEEISVAGVEGEWWHQWDEGPRMGIVVGTGYGPDFLGRLLALRGFAIGDGLSGVNTHLPLPNGTHTDIFHEEDHRPAAYTWVTLGDAKDRGTLRAGYFDSRGDQDTQGVWHTQLGTVGAILHPLPRTDLVVQYLSGEAHVRTPSNDSSFRAFYALLSQRYKGHRFTIRYDEFRVRDLDGGNPTAESGHGITAAWLYEWGLRHRIGLEYLWLDSNRPASATPKPSQDGWQLSYRFRY